MCRSAVLLLLLIAWIPLSKAQVPASHLDVHRPATRSSSVADDHDMKSDQCFRSELENDRVRVFQVEIAPHQSSGLDRHGHDYIVISLGDSKFEIEDSINRFNMELQSGEMQVIQGGGTHRVNNLSDRALRLIEIDVAKGIRPQRPFCGLNARQCNDGAFGKGDNGSYSQSTLFETETVKLARVQLGASSMLPTHRHERSHLIVALDDASLLDDSQDREMHLKAGEPFWYSQALSHRLKNTGTQEISLITVDFK